MQRLLDIENLRTTFDIHVGKVQAVRGVNLHVDEGETVGVVGESGCGKSVSMLSVLHLLPDYAKISADKMIFDGTDLTRLTPKMFRKISGDQIGMIFQDPMTSLNPLFTVGDQLTEPLRIHKGISKKEARDLVLEKLRMVEIPDPESRMKQYPHEFSGGQRQRVGIARALACNPEFIVCDEPISALDVSIQAQVINTLESLQEKLGLSYLFVSHDLSLVRHISHNVGVMYLGCMVERAPVQELYSNMLHPYTRALMSAVPIPDPDLAAASDRIHLSGDVPTPIDPPSGCRFRARCPYATEQCAAERPALREVTPGHFVACHKVK